MMSAALLSLGAEQQALAALLKVDRLDARTEAIEERVSGVSLRAAVAVADAEARLSRQILALQGQLSALAASMGSAPTIDLASPGPIGGTTPSTIQGTTITATAQFSGSGAGLTSVPAAALSISGQTTGDLLYASSGSAWARLADVATGQVLTSGGVGVAPAWSASPAVTTLTGTTSLLTPLLDRATAGVLTLGGTATSVNIAPTLLTFTGAGGISAYGSSIWSVNGTSNTLRIDAHGGALSIGTLSGGTVALGNTSQLTAINGLNGVSINGSTGVELKRLGATMFDVGVTSANNMTLAAGKSLSMAAGSGGLSLGSGTGPATMPTGDYTATLAAGKFYRVTTSAGLNGDITLKAGAANSSALFLEATDGSGGVVIRGGVGVTLGITGAVVADVGGTTSTAMTLRAGKGLNLAAGAGGIDASAATGALRLGAATATIGLYGVAAVAQHSSTGQTAGFTAGVGMPVLVDSTFTGGTGATAYTIGDVVRALKLLGAMAA